jgi:serine phosphatase RsbU (regulator of sigma subunit)
MRKRGTAFLGLIGMLLLAALLGRAAGLGALPVLATSAALVLALLWVGVAVFRLFLWRVGRKLAFSYFLIGVLPIPMVLLLVGVASYLLMGALVGHLFRDTLQHFHRELEETSLELLRRFVQHGEAPPSLGDLTLGYYRDGRRVAGAPETPEEWPGWLVEPETEASSALAQQVPFLLASSGEPVMTVAIEGGGAALLALFHGDLERELRERSGIWVQLERWDSVEVVGPGGRSFALRAPGGERTALREEFFGGASARELPWRQRPVLYWAELLSAARSLAAPERPVKLGAALNATPDTIVRQVVSGAAEVDTAAWGILVAVGFLLFDIYAVAALMALFMIFGLSRAVNRLHRATSAVRQGDFSVRIPVKRRDQVGELQRSFNEMAANLEKLVATAAQKESLEKELAIARELQQNLLPSSLTTTEAVELASYFEPSAAIGGDYFDLLRLEDGRLAVVVADVSGHGLSAGLRMAMLKAALVMLVEQGLAPEQILRRLNTMIRADESVATGRPMVTATISLFDPATGRLELTNAGHPPAYRLRRPAGPEGGTAVPPYAGEPLEVEEIVLPSPPLGALGVRYASRALTLEPGELVVWLSDGLIECPDGLGEPFGYERIEVALRGPGRSAAEVRDRLLAQVAAHCGGQPPEDDRTLVVMRYLPAA